MKIGLVGYRGGGKSTLFELLTGDRSDPSKIQTGQVGMAAVPDERFDRLIDLYRPKKQTPAQIELFDTPGLSRDGHEGNAQRLGIIREAKAVVQVVGAFDGGEAPAEVRAFQEDLVLADLQVVANRIERLRQDAAKPRPDREELQEELEALEPLEAELSEGRSLGDLELSESQEKACRSFSLLTRKRRLVVLNTAEAGQNGDAASRLEEAGHRVVTAPVGLELEVAALPPEDRDEFAREMGLEESSKSRILRAVFEITDQITFFTCAGKEVHAWLLPRGGTALDAAGTIHSDLARGFIRAEVMAADDLIRLGSEREVKAAGLHHIEGKDYVVQDGDVIVVRFSI